MPRVDYAAPGKAEYNEPGAEEEEKHSAVVYYGKFVEKSGCLDYCDCTVFVFSFVWLGFDELVSQEEKYRNVADKCNWDIDNKAPTPGFLLKLVESP